MSLRNAARPAAWLALGLLGVMLTACGGSGGNGSVGAGTCPTTPVRTVVSVDQWGDIVRALGGACARVTTVIESSAADPHEYEPTAGDIAAFSDAQLVVVNGAGYDEWAAKAVAGSGKDPTVVDAAVVAGVKSGANPHLWYSPGYVYEVADAVTAELKRQAPAAAAYFDSQAKAWDVTMKPYRVLIANLGATHPNAPYAATETVFDYMAQAIGLVDLTPAGYRNASANGSEPAPGDVAAFDRLLRAKKVDVLIENTQTSGSVPERITGTATSAGVPVVGVTESVPPGVDSFVAWQVGQLRALQKALGSS